MTEWGTPDILMQSQNPSVLPVAGNFAEETKSKEIPIELKLTTEAVA